jgi:hypothetical protein
LLHLTRPAVTLVPLRRVRNRTAIEELRVLRAGVFNGGRVGVGDAMKDAGFSGGSS